MAIRQLRYEGDEILRKKSRVVENIDDRIKTLVEDMIETMNKEDGVGLAAPQVGVLKRVVVVDVGKGPIVMINPEIISEEGEKIEDEGCLSVPEKSGKVSRPQKVRVKFTDLDGKVKEMEGQNLLARAFCHEIDHLEGILYVDKVID